FYSGTLVTPADPPQKSNRPSVLVFIAAGMFLGILLGAIAALIVSRVGNGPGSTDQRSKTSEEAEPAEATATDDDDRPEQPSFTLDEDDTLADSESEEPGALQPMSARSADTKRR